MELSEGHVAAHEDWNQTFPNERWGPTSDDCRYDSCSGCGGYHCGLWCPEINGED
jgi:hypothetical protein